ncbi:MAG: penicillin-binding protein 1B, partial [Arenimonas sp.]
MGVLILRVVLVCLGLFLGLALPYVWYLDKQVRTEFAQLQWQVPTRVYARPLALREGIRLNPEALELELSSATYRKDGVGQLPGTYVRDGGQFRIGTRAFTDMDGPVAARRLQVDLAGGRLARLRDVDSKRRPDVVRIDPARIATLYGIDEEERRLVRMAEVPPLLIT